ncbi:hypothetical protein A9Z42_0032410 [Trichoderma parareesei]|uniref:Uncharacterized protein n=1 Tax=Trichoderma parareesei TaxID=858221 RepID=A0A2H2Z9M7_TRIPA|nr:hypothetical protein A9Z42_0032410 [Trichoderma parareesei]
MAHDARGRRERPRRSTGGSEAYQLPQRRRAVDSEAPRGRLDGLDFEDSWGPEPHAEGEYLSRRDYAEEVEAATRPVVVRARGDARPFPTAHYRRQRSSRREHSGVELNRERIERVVISESPTGVRHANSSNGEDDERIDRSRVYDDEWRGEPDDQAPDTAHDGMYYGRTNVERHDYFRRRPVSPIIEDIDTFDEFQFTFPTKDPSKDTDSELEAPTTESESTQQVGSSLSSVVTAPGIFASSYHGTAELGAQHEADLTVLHDLRGQTQPLFRWLHIRQETMNFDAFWVQVSRHIQFRDAERNAVASLQAEVKRQCAKTRYSPQGAKAFIAHFHAFWPRKIEFWRKDRLITADNWDRILKMAEGSKSDVKLKLKLADTPDMLRPSVKSNVVGYKASEKCHKGSAVASEYLHVFTLLSKSAEASDDGILQDLQEQLSAAERFLTEKTSYSAQRGYRRCELETRDGLREHLERLAARVDEKKSDIARRSYDDCLAIFNMADMLFQTFFPLTFQGSTTGKYWGALSKLMKIPELDGDNAVYDSTSSISEMKNALWQLTQDIPSFQDIMSFSGKEDRATMTLPQELVTAWLHIVFGLIYSTYAPDWYSHIMKARQLMRDGMQKMIQSISNENLLDKAVMLPTEIMSLITLNLLHDDVGKYDDICDTYSLYLNLLDTDITTKPSNRTYQHRIDLVKQEMAAIRRTLAKQRSIIAMLRNKTSYVEGNFVVRYGEEMPSRMRAEYDHDARIAPGYRYRAADDRTLEVGDYDRRGVGVQFLNDLEAASKLSPTDVGGFRSLFLADCAKLVEQREYEFRRDTEYAEDLEREISYKMEWTKDKQENAIYAFTLVTIIFLPLSAISSIFGMNTNDIRNMNFDQWLYWAVALPVTLIIIFAGLWWMDELGNATEWLIGRRSRSPEYGSSLPSGAGTSRPIAPVADYDSTGRPSEEMPGTYRRAHYMRPTMRSYSGNAEVVLPAVPRPRRRRSSYYKY